MGWYNPWGYGAGYGSYGTGYGAYGYGGSGTNGFYLIVVLFILLIIVGNSYPMGGAYS
ncbi:uncharacterized protein (TIGR01732 family) [Salirhabdus euzebyi]|uniref:Uncharacterized protein (TIGR01732 family) n=1 Tax=Salirhabdus euzebyi TaxID=394506 RepID=A0A841Q2C9_9BACI|nr:YjcZ family sporulation protein [Salirhabdus euzebyi]MBB6452405.1 uncharacterized protein (TIGR01732 family) [Salirhabdus euzebyi]